ncbi:hypothetical protein [Clostridium fungisolvens]|uniref:Uncharacterized protein n=1 Tax=Clostridium fungisolvens TaxID=1604897 RepID=A0A6V8STI1_9CLOT|nr:hypothetical protein [Clostridium fungisolvens]GFP78558.1 hypothetical protein bsdtw1_04795 [Clostridium fungisolvens]
MATDIGNWFVHNAENFNNLMENLGDWFSNIGTNIKDLPNLILDGLKNLLVSLFVPSDNYFTNNFNSLKDSVSSKFGNSDLNELKQLGQVGGSVSTSMTADLKVGGVSFTGKVVDFSWIDKYIDTIHGWVAGLMGIMLLIYNYSQILWLIRGTSPIVTSSSTSTEG